MAADVGLRYNSWSYSDLPYSDHDVQDSSVQQMVLNHGSVSFGRFATESLSWEKRSVFEHNRRQEELSRLTAPGLVAQKKAFFEEYYKKARHLKAQRAMHQPEVTMEERNDDSTMGHSSQADELPSVASDPSSSIEPSTEVSSSDERKCQGAHELGYLTFNPLFSQTAGLPNIHEERSSSGEKQYRDRELPSIHEERSSSGEKQYRDRELPSTAQRSKNNGFSYEAVERKVLAPRHVVSNNSSDSNVAGSKIVLPIASLQSECLKVDPEKGGARKNVPIINRSTKTSKGLPTSVISIPRVDLKRNSENSPSQDLKDPFHKRVQMKLRALSDRMDAYKTAVSSRSASYQPERAMASFRSSYQNADRAATCSRSSLCQNSGRTLAPCTLASHESHKYLNGVLRGIFFNKGSSTSLGSSSNSTATGKLAAKILVMPSSSQVTAKGSRTAQVTLKRAAGPTSVNIVSQNKRKHTPAALDEKNPKGEYVRTSTPPSARSSSDNLPRAAKAPKFSNVTDGMAKTEVMQKSRSSSNPIGGRNMMTKRSVNCNEQNRKVIQSRAGNLTESSMRSNLKGDPLLSNKNPRQERPRWR